MAFSFKMLIAGKLVEGESDFDVINPSTGEPFCKAPSCTSAQLDKAVDAARKAFPAWARTPPAERQAMIRKAAEKIQERTDDLVQLLVKEQGKPLMGPRDDLAGGKPLAGAEEELAAVVGTLQHIADTQFEFEKTLVDDQQELIIQKRVPIGVVGGITPWNFPPLMATWKFGEALATGNVCIIKPSPYTPLTTLALGEILADVFPAGVLTMLSGGDELGKLLVAHHGVDKISFTGSTKAGMAIQAAASQTLKRVTLELGGNDPAVVLEDADPKFTAKGLFGHAMGNSGQVCIAIKRAFVHEKIYDEVVEELSALANKAVTGDGFGHGVQFGPLNNKMQYDKVKSIMEDSQKQGAKVVGGGKLPEGKGYFIPPTIMTASEGMRIVDEEQFGPVLPVLKWNDLEDVIDRANRTEYGLGASVWSNDLQRANQVADRIHAGTVWINCHAQLSANVPFGGCKCSGIGKQLGQFTLDGYTEAKIVRMAKSKGSDFERAAKAARVAEPQGQ